jgi:putative redox protein
MFAERRSRVNREVAMVTTESRTEKFVTIASNGHASIQIDAPINKGGGGKGFGAHELLEASIAACINMSLRMYASTHDIPLESVAVTVSIARPDDLTVQFSQSVELGGPLTKEHRSALRAVAESCPVRQTLSKKLDFVSESRS